MTDEPETEAEAEEESEMDDAISFAQMMAFAVERVETEMDEFPGEVPGHAESLLVADIGALHGTLMNVQMAQANEEMDDPDEDAIQNALESDVVDIILALGALKKEYDLDIVEAFEDRMEMIRTHEALQAAMESAESQEEQMAALEEHLGEDAIGQMMGGMGMAPPPEPGDDVTSDDYDPEDPERHIQ